MSTVDYDAPPAYDSPEVQAGTRKYGIFTVHVHYAKSSLGIIKVIAVVLSLIAFICVVAADWCDSTGPYRFFEFATQTTFWSTVVLYFIYLMGVDAHIKFINWPLTELVWSGLDTLFLIISSIVLAAKTCGFNSLRAGAAFGFFTTFAMGINTILIFRVFRSHAVLSDSSKHQSSTETKY